MEGDWFRLPCFFIPFYFNPLPPHGGRLLLGIEQISAYHISIHSLRMEGDCVHLRHYLGTDISIHSLRMEGDCQSSAWSALARSFQSTPSAWRETFPTQ